MSYETPKVVTVHNPQIGLLRRVLQVLVILYVAVYQLWYAQEDIIATVFLKLSWQKLSLKIFSFEVEVSFQAREHLHITFVRTVDHGILTGKNCNAPKYLRSGSA